MTTITPWPAPREGTSLSIDRFPAIDTVLLRDFGGLFPLSFFAILDMLVRKTTLRLDPS
jgi:hypothetical protein